MGGWLVPGRGRGEAGLRRLRTYKTGRGTCNSNINIVLGGVVDAFVSSHSWSLFQASWLA